MRNFLIREALDTMSVRRRYPPDALVDRVALFCNRNSTGGGQLQSFYVEEAESSLLKEILEKRTFSFLRSGSEMAISYNS
jgi:hypothetical protein